jgi:hypothetical protein
LEATQRGKQAALPQLLFHLLVAVLVAMVMRKAAGLTNPSSEKTCKKELASGTSVFSRGQNWVPMVVVQDAPDRPVYQSTGMNLVQPQVRET